jgi:hypothetical protein
MTGRVLQCATVLGYSGTQRVARQHGQKTRHQPSTTAGLVNPRRGDNIAYDIRIDHVGAGSTPYGNTRRALELASQAYCGGGIMCRGRMVEVASLVRGLSCGS